MRKKRTMVVGGAGFIGSHIVDALLDDGQTVCVVDDLFLGKTENVRGDALFAKGDASCFECISELVHSFKPSTIYNLAVLPLPHSLENPYDNIDKNVKIVQNLCNLLQERFFKRLIHFSSSEIYGSALYSPMCEEHPMKPLTPYAASKAAGDLICLSYVKTFDCNITIIRPFNNYGPRQNAGSYAGVIPLTINRIRNNEEVIIYGDGKQTRDYIFVRDTARAALMIGKRDDLKGEVFNIGSGKDISIEELIGKIYWGMCSEPLKIKHKKERPGDVHRHIANCLKAKDVLGFEPSISLDQGLKETIKWYHNLGLK